MQNDLNKIIESLKQEDWINSLPVKEHVKDQLLNWVEEKILPEFLSTLSRQVDEIIDINPEFSEPDILAMTTRYMVDFLGAQSASVRIYDPSTEQMLSYGSHPYKEKTRKTYIPLENSIAGEVVKNRKPYLVPNILNEDLYLDKEVVIKRGSYSMMAVPLEIPRFSPLERNTVGVIQIYYPDIDRHFSALETQLAELYSRRISYVIANKKINTMYRVNIRKEVIVQKIFQKLGTRAGVKMKDIFNQVIPELVDIINLESCALFSVSRDLKYVVLEAGYPDSMNRHGIGKRFSVKSEPAFEAVLGLREFSGESPYELITPSYILVMDPQKSRLVSDSVRKFSENHSINSILYVPLHNGEEITHFMTFDALDQKQSYSIEEIEIFLFLVRELVKAQRMEVLDDILHDFKNPAIATAGFARRLKQLLQSDDSFKKNKKIATYLNILLEETSRMQEMAMSLSQVGQERVLDLTSILKGRFEINKEAIKEQLKQNVSLREGPFEDPLKVKCYRLQLERAIDNLLNNATSAIPSQGGILSVRTFSEGEYACAEITNTGVIPEEERLRLMEGEGRGRGLYITHRIMQVLNGKIEVIPGKETTTVRICLPLWNEEG